MMNNGNPTTAAELVGQTWHCLSNTRYKGTYEIAEATPVDETWIHIRTTSRVEWHVRLIDCFPTEEAARAEARARRKPRQKRQPQPLYGDFATIAMVNGIATDGTGRRVR